MAAGDKGMSHVPVGMELDSVRFHHTPQNSLLFNIVELLISGTSHLVLQTTVDCG